MGVDKLQIINIFHWFVTSFPLLPWHPFWMDNEVLGGDFHSEIAYFVVRFLSEENKEHN